MWLHAEIQNKKIKYLADSDAIMTKGIIALLIRVFSNQKASEISKTKLYFVEKIGLKDQLSATRANGLLSMKKEKDMQKLGEDIVSVICEIYDPEIPVNIYALGLIYDVQVSQKNDVKITMTLTSPNCPVAETLPLEVEKKVKKVPNVNKVSVEIVFDPPWTKDMMSEEAKLELGML